MSSTVSDILAKAVQGARIQPSEAVALFWFNDLAALGMAADRVCQRLHPEPYRTYVVDRNINYTNICVSRCKFCAFNRQKGDADAYVLSLDELFRKIDETLALGGTQILMQGGLHPDLKLDFYVEMLRAIKGRFQIHIHAFSPPEIVHFARLNGLATREVIAALKAAGLDTIPGGGAEILVDERRQKISPLKCTADEWVQVMREAHALGMRTTATMMFGHVETVEDRVAHLDRIRGLQDETRGFTAFIPWTFQPKNTALDLPPVCGFEYLKTLAISRLYLDNVPNLQASWVTQGGKIAQLALKFGANDMGSTMIEENVVRAAGVSFRLPRDEMMRLIQDLGWQARQRDCYYRLVG